MTIDWIRCGPLYAIAFIFLALAGNASYASDPPDCTKLTPAQCTKQSLEWAEKLQKSREVGDAWSAGCARDKVTLEWTCFTTRWFGTGNRHQLRVQHHPATGYCFAGAQNDFPGREAVIRVGSNTPIRYQKSLVCGTTAKTIIEQLLTEQVGATRGNIWPSGHAEFEFDSSGFPQAFEALKARVSNPRP